MSAVVFECYWCKGTEFAEVRPLDWRCTGCNSSKVQMRAIKNLIDEGIPAEDAEDLVNFAASRGRELREAQA